MLVILYPDNTAYPDNDIRVSIGTNETFGIPAERPAPYGKGMNDTETYIVGNDTIKAFYTTLDHDARVQYAKEYNIEYQRMMKPRNNTSRNRKKEMLNRITNLLQGNVCPINA